MLERTLYQILKAGEEEINENPNFLKNFFAAKGLSETEIDGIAQYWAENGVEIKHEYPRGEPTGTPIWSIQLVSEAEQSPRFLGDEAGTFGVTDDCDVNAPEFGADIIASFWFSNYAIVTYSQLPDIGIYYYELLKFFMMRSRPFLKSSEGANALHTEFGGGDITPDPRYAPTYMFVRRFNVGILHPECAASNADVGVRAFKVGGIHVNNAVIGVDPKVDPYVEE